MTHQLVKSRSLENRLKRFWSILVSLFFFYAILNYYLDIKMVLVDYFMYPLVILALLFLFLKKSVHTIARTAVAPDLRVSYKDYLFNFTAMVGFIAITVVAIALVPGLFLSGTLNLTTTDNTELAKVASHYYGRLWLMMPWPVLMVYIGFLGSLAQNYAIFDIKSFVHKIYKSEFENDTIHNLLMALYHLPYILVISWSTVIAIYASYFAISSFLGLTAMQGVNYGTLAFGFITLIFLTRKKIKDLFRAYNYHTWSILKFLAVCAVSLILWLLLPTVLFNIVGSDSLVNLKGDYNFYNYDIRFQYLFFIWVLWWFCMPMIGYVCYQQLKQYSYKKSMVLSFLAMALVCGVFSLAPVSSSLFDSTLFLLNSASLKLPALVLMISLVLYYVFNNKYDHHLFTIDFISKEDSIQKSRPASRAYYYLFLILTFFLSVIILENLFILYKLLSFFAIINLLLLLYFMYKLRVLSPLKH